MKDSISMRTGLHSARAGAGYWIPNIQWKVQDGVYRVKELKIMVLVGLINVVNSTK